MRNPDGTETLLTLAAPLPMMLVAELCLSIGEACERAGYTDAAMLTDGTNRIVARPASRTGEV